jgi:hypothetical protein
MHSPNHMPKNRPMMKRTDRKNGNLPNPSSLNRGMNSNMMSGNTGRPNLSPRNIRASRTAPRTTQMPPQQAFSRTRPRSEFDITPMSDEMYMRPDASAPRRPIA